MEYLYFLLLQFHLVSMYLSGSNDFEILRIYLWFYIQRNQTIKETGICFNSCFISYIPVSHEINPSKNVFSPKADHSQKGESL